MPVGSTKQSMLELNSIDQINFLEDTKDLVEVGYEVGTGELIDELPDLN